MHNNLDPNLPPGQQPHSVLISQTGEPRGSALTPFFSLLLLFFVLICDCVLLLCLCYVFPAPDSFCYKKFFQLCGLSSKTPKEIKDVFQILDEDNSGYIEESELKCVKQWQLDS